MNVVLDTGTLQYQLRKPKPPKKIKRGAKFVSRRHSLLEQLVDLRRLRLVIDSMQGGLVSEWHHTCGEEVVRQLVIRWHGNRVFVFRRPTRLPHPLKAQLGKLGFRDTVDVLVLELALATREKRVISDDPDFWNPLTHKGQAHTVKGQNNAPVAKFCREQLGITVTLMANYRHLL